MPFIVILPEEQILPQVMKRFIQIPPGIGIQRWVLMHSLTILQVFKIQLREPGRFTEIFRGNTIQLLEYLL